MVGRLGKLVIASAIYGFAIGSVHSRTFAIYNLVKFPLLILITAAVCSVSYYAAIRFVTRRLSFGEVQGLAVGTFQEIALLLASLSPVSFFLAKTIRQPDAEGLNEYPLFLGLNVLLIAICGTVALIRRTSILVSQHSLDARMGALVMFLWLSLSLFVGAQCAWYLRPFFGVSTIDASQVGFIEGTRPDHRGATSFYEAVYHLFVPPAPAKASRLRLPRKTVSDVAPSHGACFDWIPIRGASMVLTIAQGLPRDVGWATGRR